MGLTIQVGYDEWWGSQEVEDTFTPINQILLAHSLPNHHEPFPPPPPLPLDWETYGYHGLHYLRRLAAHLWASSTLPQTPGNNENISDDPVIKDYYIDLFDVSPSGNFNHLMFHSDADGLYIPLAFEKVLFSPDLAPSNRFVGSSSSLLAECLRLARALELPEDLDKNDDDLFDAIEAQATHQPSHDQRLWIRYAVEAYVCRNFVEACRLSVTTGCALRFR
jgi:hypothetical protein